MVPYWVCVFSGQGITKSSSKQPSSASCSVSLPFFWDVCAPFLGTLRLSPADESSEHHLGVVDKRQCHERKQMSSLAGFVPTWGPPSPRRTSSRLAAKAETLQPKPLTPELPQKAGAFQPSQSSTSFRKTNLSMGEVSNLSGAQATVDAPAPATARK